MTFTLPLPPNLNGPGYGHWRLVENARKKWVKQVNLLACHRDFPSPPPAPFARVTIAATMIMPAAMDEENAMRRASKWALDWLKRNGYIVDDSRKHVKWSGFPEQRISRKQTPTLILTLIPIADSHG